MEFKKQNMLIVDSFFGYKDQQWFDGSEIGGL